MGKSLLVSILLLSFVGGKGLAKPIWSHGELSLTNGTVLAGDLSYNWKAEIVQYREGNIIKAFSAFQVSGFKYFDATLNTLRTFKTVDYPVKENFNRSLFLEQIGIGPMMIYRRLRHARDPIKIGNPSASAVDDMMLKRVDNFTYYVFEGDRMTNLTDFDTELWPRMQQEFSDELAHYSGTLHMDLNSTFARLLLITQYNQLKVRATHVTSLKVPTESVSLY
ncbi:hypothetical protein [Spirosoma agri]|uniref:Uncharacterized protein n=1 Tax=Spirosoma agri TaxID=1987381 RepID=A0A6M0IEX6_9BACT|nr:hypothetical protein [Spirosoma agri]NEU65881.1 hypothetical protein [Spirosoma agri]